MSQNIYTGLSGTYLPPPAWDGTPAPEGDDLATLATHWRAHGDKDGSLEERIHGLILNRARYQVFKLTSPGPWSYEVAGDAATNAMLCLGQPSWDPGTGTWSYVDMVILNYWRSQVRRKIRRFIPMISLDSDETIDVEEPRKDYRFKVDQEKWDSLYPKLSPLERKVLESYRGGHGRHGEMRSLAMELGKDVRQIDNSIERIKRKARALGIMPYSKRKRKRC